MTTYLIFACSSGFLDPQIMNLYTKTNVIRQLEAELWKLTRFWAAILNFEFLGGNRWSGVVVPAIFGISIPKKNSEQIFMLSSQSARPFHIISALLVFNTSCDISSPPILVPEFHYVRNSDWRHEFCRKKDGGGRGITSFVLTGYYIIYNVSSTCMENINVSLCVNTSRYQVYQRLTVKRLPDNCWRLKHYCPSSSK